MWVALACTTDQGNHLSLGAALDRERRARILLLSVKPWPSSFRFAQALQASGAIVDVLCPRSHPFHQTWREEHIHPYNPRFPLTSFIAAIESVSPDILVAGDEIAIREILQLYWNRREESGPADHIVSLIERSLGDPDVYPKIFRRSDFVDIAKSEEIRAAKTKVVGTRKDLTRAAREFGYPCALKTDHSAGGAGVEIIGTEKAASAALRRLRWKHLRGKVAAALRGQISFRRLFLEPVLPTVNLQEFVSGRPATTAFACWEGKVVGAVHVEVVQESQPRGPATVVRQLQSAKMDAVARKIASRLRLSGVHGLDYMVDSTTGEEVLIEMNPRLTQIAHFNLGSGRDPAHGLVSAISTVHVPARAQAIKSDTVALFPQEMQRDPNSRFLSSAYHDLPDHDLV